MFFAITVDPTVSTLAGVILAAMFGTTVGPASVQWMQGRSAAKKEARDYARADLLATRALEAAAEQKLLLDGIAEQGRKTHALVNSDMTTQLKASLASLTSNLAVLKRIQAINIAAGESPNEDDLTQMAQLTKDIANLQIVLADRARIQAEIDRDVPVAEQAVPAPPPSIIPSTDKPLNAVT